ncbi:integrase arm-type DNA-binding domain-containing protein [Sphingomonas cannabina]|uniref:tyrosine-type recombinase/integrase n=1 Tax=Sphingomonas cannabina TaxID=2899123 RepID=UPI001F15C43A|nr:integrase arm-type DNA-binding domain-containing protein [Sphingomonas cannabina]UIJ44740.1 integrase arm-type DNA-binding domain-containing protein [Sphingomonas cannabina]
MGRKVALTPASIDALQKGLLADLLTPGLAIEVLASGKKRWRFRRLVAGTKTIVTMFGGLFPARTIADAREWARGLNEKVEAGTDPRIALREEKARAEMTVARAHGLYMVAVREGRSSRAKRPNKPRTIKDKLDIYNRDIAPKLAKRSIYEVTETDLIKLIEAKGKVAKIRANRLAAELKVFFGWAASLRGLEVGLEVDPSRRLGDLRFPETERSRNLSLLELEWFLTALVDEPRWVQRGMLLWLLTAARISELVKAKSAEVVDGVWTIPSPRVKNSFAHTIALGPWGRTLMQSNHEWIFPAPRADGPRNNSVWYKARDRVRARMAALAGQPIERFTPHDFRRTARSNTKRLKVDYETAEAMLNHVKKGLERTYDQYALEEEKRAWFLAWEQEVAAIAKRAGVAEALGVPEIEMPRTQMSVTLQLPQGSGVQPSIDFGTPEARTAPILAQPAAKFIFPREAWRPALSQAIDLSSRQPCDTRKLVRSDEV